MAHKHWLTKAEAADYCRVKPRTIDNWRKRGLPAYKRGAVVLFKTGDLDVYIECGMEEFSDGEHQQRSERSAADSVHGG